MITMTKVNCVVEQEARNMPCIYRKNGKCTNDEITISIYWHDDSYSTQMFCIDITETYDKKKKVKWPKNQVWCTGGKHPKPCIPKFDKDGVIISPIGCSHPSTLNKSCECECHKKPRTKKVNR